MIYRNKLSPSPVEEAGLLFETPNLNDEADPPVVAAGLPNTTPCGGLAAGADDCNIDARLDCCWKKVSKMMLFEKL